MGMKRKRGLWPVLLLVSALWMGLSSVVSAQETARDGQVITLQKAHRLALEYNPQIHNIEETLYQARATVWKAWTLLTPTLRATGNLIRNDKEIAFGMPDFEQFLANPTGPIPMENMVMQELWDWRVGFTASIALFNPRSIPLLKNAYDNVDFRRYHTSHQKNELLFAVTTAYYQIRASKEALRIARENLKIAEEFQRLSRERVRVGQGTKLDELRADSDVNAARKELSNAEDSLRLSRTALSYLIGVQQPFETVEPDDVEPMSGDLQILTEKALRDRLDLRATQLSVVMANRNKAATWTKWLPVFDLTYSWNYAKSKGFSGEHDSWALIFGASWTLFDGGMTIVELAEDGSVLRQAQNSVIQMGIEIRHEVEQALVNLEKARRNVAFSRQQVLLAEETHHLVRRQYELGMATSLDVVNASSALVRSRVALVLEELGLKLVILQLNKATGQYYAQASGGI